MGRGTSKASKSGTGKIEAKTYALFHGSPNADIDQFDISKAGTNTSTGEKFLFFTDSKEAADDFSYERVDIGSTFFEGKGKKGKVYEVDVTMNNPLDFTNLSPKDVQNIKEMSRNYDFGELSDRNIKLYSENNNQLFKASLDINKIADYGYDGFIARMNSKGDKEYAVIDAKQVKIKKRK